MFEPCVASLRMSEGTIVGPDNLNDYYDPTLKDYRLSEIEKAKLGN